MKVGKTVGQQKIISADTTHTHTRVEKSKEEEEIKFNTIGLCVALKCLSCGSEERRYVKNGYPNIPQLSTRSTGKNR